MGQRSNKRVQLEDLLKLKRHEKPEPEFWVGFDERLERRRLQALISGPEEGRSRLATLSRWLLWTTPVAAVLAMGVFVVRAPSAGTGFGSSPETVVHTPTITVENAPRALVASLPSRPTTTARTEVTEAEVESSESRFVLDVLTSRAEELPFQRVLANPAFSAGGRGNAHFVADRLSSSRGGSVPVTLLIDRSRSQF